MESAGPAMQMAQLAGRDLQTFGRGLEQAGNAYQGYQDRLKAEAEASDLKARDAGVVRSLTTLLHDKGTGYLRTKGAAALDGHADVASRVDQIAESFANGLDDPKRRQEFLDLARQRATAALSQIEQHAANETKAYGLEASAMRAETASQSAVSSFNPMPGADNTAFRQAMGTVHAELEYQGVNRHGLKGPELEQFIKDGIGATKAGLVQHLVANDQNDAAERVFKSMRDGGELKPDLADKLQVLIESSRGKGDAIRAAHDIAAEGGTIGEQEKKLYARYDRGDFGQGKRGSETYEMALGNLRAEATQREHERVQVNNQILGGVLSQKLARPNMTMAQLPASVLARMKTDFQFGKAIDSMFGDTSADPVVNAEAYYNVFSHLGDGSDLDLSTRPDTDVFTFRKVLGDKVFDQKLVPLIATLRRREANQPNKDPANVDLPKLNTMIEERLAGVAPELVKPKTSEDKARRGAILRTVHDDVRAGQVQAGEVFDQGKLSSAVDRAFMQQSPMQSWTNPFRNAIGAPPASGTMLKMKVGDIPAAARKGIEAAFRERGITNPDDQMMLTQYWKTYGRR